MGIQYATPIAHELWVHRGLSKREARVSRREQSMLTSLSRPVNPSLTRDTLLGNTDLPIALTCKVIAFSAVFLAGILTANFAVAQGFNTGLQAPVQEIVENNVDMVSGMLVYKQTDLSIGQADSSNYMRLDRIYRSLATSGTGWASFGPWEHNYKFYIIDITGESFNDFDVVIGQESHSFRLNSDGTYANLKRDGGTLVSNGSIWTFTSNIGDTATFDGSIPCSYVGYCAYATKVERRDGVKIYLNYGPAGSLYSGDRLIVNRLKSVTNSFGYGFNFTYLDEGTASLVNQSRLTVASIDSVKSTCPSAPTSCAATILATASYQYGTSGTSYMALTSVSGAGLSRRYAYDPNYGGLLRSAFQTSYPTIPEFTVEYAPPPWGYGRGPLTASVSKKTDSSGFATNYTWEFGTGIPIAHKAVNPLGGTIKYEIAEVPLSADRSATWLAHKITDSNNGLKVLEYDEYLRPTSIQYPEGNTKTVTYDDRGNVLSATLTPKSSSTAPNIVSHAIFPSLCTTTTTKTCNRPTYEIDADGHRKNYSWFSSNGELNTETDGLDSSGNCAISGGVCPQTSQVYSQFTAQDGSAVYLIVSKTKRIDATSATTQLIDYRSTQAYAVGRTVDDYGGANLTSCNSYDSVGNNISKTLPNAGLAVCP